MATIHMHASMSATPEQFVSALTDFGPGRQELFGNSSDDYLKVHHLAATEADVTEGSGSAWERLHYDWSDPNRIVMTTTDSNLWGGRSGHTYTLIRKADGGTELDAVVIRQGKNFKGHTLDLVLSVFGKAVLGKALKGTVRAIDARYSREQSGAPGVAAAR